MAAAPEEIKHDGPPPEAEGLAATSYAQQCRDVIALVNRFRTTGAHFDLDLPTIVFIGDQSTGKSSLLEALSGIALPRSEGTCTRCPTELRMTETDTPWQCTIRLRFEFDDIQKQKLVQVKELQFGPVITNKDLVQDYVARAQLALLNPNKKHTEFLPADDKDKVDAAGDAARALVGFTRNVVCVDVRGPGVSNLSLIDLPGIIRSSDKLEERQNIQLVKQMVKDYTKPDNSIIVALVSCKQEMEHTVVRDIAREADPNGERTLGVLTKPDTVERGAYQSKIDVLMGKTYALNLGYYCVKTRTPQELLDNVSFKASRDNERIFFAQNEPWKSLPAHLRKRLTTDNLEAKLTELLTKKIQDSLPSMKQKTGQLLQITRDMLKQMAPPLQINPREGRDIGVRMALLTLTRDFIQELKELVAAQTGSKLLWRTVHANFREFWKHLTRTRPAFTFRKNSKSGGVVSDVMEGMQNALGINTGTASDSADGEESLGRTYTFDEVKKIIDAERGRQLPGMGGNAPYEAKTRLIASFLQLWRAPAQECVTRINLAVQEVVRRVVKERLGRFAKLQGVVSLHLVEFFGELESKTRATVNMLIDMELNHPFTLNSQYFDSSKQSIIKSLRQTAFAPAPTGMLANAAATASAAVQNIQHNGKGAPPPALTAEQREAEAVQGALVALNRLGISGYSPETIKDLAYMPITAKDKSLDEVLEVVAEVLAYFKVALKRVGDNVPMAIDHQFLLQFSKTVDEELIHKLNLLEADKSTLTNLLDEDPTVVRRREELAAKEQRLDEVFRELVKFGVRDT